MNIKIALKLNEFEGYFYVCWTWIQLERNQSRVFTPSVVNHKPLTVMSWVDKRRYSKIQKYLKRKHAVSRPLSIAFKKVNQIVRGWTNYFKIGSIKVFLDKFGQGYATRYDVLLSSMEKNQGNL